MSLADAWARFLSELSDYEAFDSEFSPNPHSPWTAMQKLVDEHGESAARLLTEQLGLGNEEVVYWVCTGLGRLGPRAGAEAAAKLATLRTRVAAEALFAVDAEAWWKRRVDRHLDDVLREQVRAGLDQSVVFMQRAATETNDEELAQLLRSFPLRDAWIANPRADVVDFLRSLRGRRAPVHTAAAEILSLANVKEPIAELVDALCLDGKLSDAAIERVASHPTSIRLVDRLMETNSLGALAALLERRRCAGLRTPSSQPLRSYLTKKLVMPERPWRYEQHEVHDAANAVAALGDDYFLDALASAVYQENTGYAWAPLTRALRVFGERAIAVLEEQDQNDHVRWMLDNLRKKLDPDPVHADATFLSGRIEPSVYGAFRAYASSLLYAPSAHAAFQLAWIDRAFGSEIVSERLDWIRSLGFHDEDFLRELGTPVARPLEGYRFLWDCGEFQQDKPVEAKRALDAGLPSLATHLKHDPAWIALAEAHVERVWRAVA